MSDSSDSSISSSRFPSFTNNQQESRRPRSPLSSVRGSSRSRSGNRSRSRSRIFKRTPSKTDDYFSTFNSTNGPGYHSPPILEDDDELRDILADQPQLPNFGFNPNPSTSSAPNPRRKAIEDEMDNDAKGIFDLNLQRDTDSTQNSPGIITPPVKDFQISGDAPKVKFYNSSDDETTEDEEGELKKSNTRIDGGSSSGTIENSNINEKDQNEDDRNQEPTLKDRFKRKMSLAFRGDDEVPDVEGEENLFSRIMKLGDVGGLAPGGSGNPEKLGDEEADAGRDHDSIPLQDFGTGPDLANSAAKGIVNEHDFYQNKDSSGSTFEFYNNNPEYNLRDGLDDFDAGALDGSDSYIEAPKRVQAGVLSSLLKMYLNPAQSLSSQTLGGSESILSGQSTPFGKKLDINPRDLKKRLKKMGNHVRNASQSSFPTSDNEDLPKRAKADLKKSTTKLTGLLYPHQTKQQKEQQQMLDDELNKMPKFHSTRPKTARKKKLLKTKRENVKAKITVHIADILQKQRFILRICKALMLYGAPTHRLEEYMQMTARVLEIDGQFIYFPGVMIVSFGDAATRTSEVQVVRCSQGLDLSKLYDAHKVYKAVVHDMMGVDEASAKIDELLQRKPLYPPWLCVFFYGFGSAMVTTWGFRGGWRDMPISFGIGLCVGFLQFYVSPKSSLYSNVFEVSASIVVSFIARALGTIHHGKTFCFGGIVQGSLALILPGYIILCGSLELQSRNIVAGSVRMFYAIIYSLFLGFGITLGAALYGWIDHDATSDTTCTDSIQLSPWFRFLFVPMFAVALGLINQARITQLPVMVFIAGLGYVVTYFSGKHFSSATEFTAAIGAFVIGILGNLYSRIGKGMAVSAMLPAIFVQVPSGIASQSSLLAGVQTADNIVNNKTLTSLDSGTSLSFGVTMVKVAIGISVGLFAAAIVVYPFGKKRTGLFTL